jgi:hypothetical protein
LVVIVVTDVLCFRIFEGIKTNKIKYNMIKFIEVREITLESGKAYKTLMYE